MSNKSNRISKLEQRSPKEYRTKVIIYADHIMPKSIPSKICYYMPEKRTDL